MFTIETDGTINVTRGDILYFATKAQDKVTKEPYTFQVGDIVRMAVYGKKNCENVVMQKDFLVELPTEEVNIFLDKKDTTFGEIINKPTDYWYEIVLNPDEKPQTIVGYDEEGARIFRLYPEGAEIPAPDEDVDPEDIPVIDDELDPYSNRPVRNKAIAKAILNLGTTLKEDWKYLNDLVQRYWQNTVLINNNVTSELAVERARIDSFVALEDGSTTGDAELQDIRIGADGNTYATAGAATRTEVLKFNRTFGLFRGMLQIDTNAKTASLIRTDGTDSKQQLITNFNSTSARSTNVTVNTDTVNLITSSACVVVLNTANGTFYCAKGADYQRTAGDVVLCGYSDSIVYPFELSEGNITVNGYKLGDQSIRAELEAQISSYQRAKFVIWNNKLIIDRVNREVTLPACYYSIYPNFASLKEVSFTQIASWAKELENELLFVILSKDEFKLSIRQRNYEFTDTDICLGGLLYGNFIPVQIGEGNVEVTKGEVKTPTMNDFFEGMFNNRDTFKIVLGGDSIVHGVGGTGWEQKGEDIITYNDRTWKRSPDSYCWAKLFKDYIESNYNATVTNNGCTGTNSYMWNVNKEQLIPADTDLCVLMVGTNDRNVRDDAPTKDVQLTKYEENLRGIVDYCHSKGIKILLCSPIPASASDEASADRAASCFELNGVVQKVCSAYGVPYVNMYNEVYFYALDNGREYDSLLADGLHPNDELYRIMFYRLLKATGLAPHYTRVN